MLMVLPAIHSIAQIAMPDKVCVGTDRHYYVEGMAGSVYTWTINGATQTATADFLDITWNTSGTYTLTVQEHQANCDGEIKTGMVSVTDPVIPLFVSIGPLCLNEVAPLLPTSSTNSITGTWSPATINTSVSGSTIFTFTPAAGQCASTVTMTIVVNNPVVTAFTINNLFCKGSMAPALPLTSDNGIPGTWSPAVISTAVAGTTTYTFTPDAGQCATTANLAVTVIEPVVPAFAAIGPLCLNSTAPPLLPVSINSIPGTWSPAVISTSAIGITNYIFTPAAGQCATTANLSIEVSAPQAFAGLPETICPGNPYTLAAATAQNYSSLLWSKSGDGTFDNPTILHPVYTPGSNDIATGIVTLTLTAPGVGTAPGCVPAVSSVTLNIIQLDADVKYSDVTCYGANDGQIIITSTGTGNYEYQVDGFGWQTKTQYKNLSPGIYKVDIRETSILSCVRTLATITIVQPDPLVATVETQDATCLGNDGIISIPSQDGGSGSYEYSLNDGPWTSTGYFAGLVPGTYHIDMRDLNVPTCTKDLGKWTIGMPVPVTAKVDKVDVRCASGNDGKIVISDAKNGSGTYEFNIGTGWSTQFTFENLVAGTYTVQMRDYNAKQCVQSLGTITVGEPLPLQATISFKNITCNGRKDGTISVQSPTGGSGTYEYTIDGITWGTTSNFTNLGPGTYYVLMRDKIATTCVRSFLPVDIVEPQPLTAVITKTDISCFGAHDGRIIVSNPLNGTLPYQYQVNGAGWQASSQFSGLGTNTYTIEISDANGCKETLGSLFIVEPKPLTATVDHTDETCKGNDGTISISNPQNSMSGLYEFTIDGGTTWTSTTIFTDLMANSYVVKIRDANLATCEQPLGTIKIVAPIPLAATGTSSDVTCYGANDGTIYITKPTGGSGLYEYSVDGANWTNSTTIVNLSPNSYTLIMKDLKAQTCSITVGTYTIIQPEQLAATVSPTDVTCYGGTDGMISFSGAKGGSGSYEYSVDGKNWFFAKINNLKANSYVVQMRDANVHSCFVTLGTYPINEPAKIIASVSSTNVSCFGANDGTITINNPQNGVPPYQYQLDGMTWQTANTFKNLPPKKYDLLVISDANNCVSTLAVVDIIEPEKLEAKYTSTNETVPGAGDGTITITGRKGGSGVFEYSKDGTTWQAGDTFTNLAPASYTIWMRDGNSTDCKIQISVLISPAGTLSAQYAISDVNCFGGLNGSIIFTNPRGATHYQFSIDNGSSWGTIDQFTFGGLAAQTYTLLVRDADNPANVASLATKDIIQPTQLQAVVTVTPESYPGAKDGGITFSSVQGGSGLYDYSIDGSNWLSTAQFTGLASGNYTVWLRDHNVPGCQISFVRTIQPAGELVADVTPVNVLCNGQNTGSILITNASGAASIEYSIDGGTTWQLNNGIFNGLVAKSYDVKIRDANKIANTVSLGVIKITEPTKLQVIFSNYSAPLCTGTFGSFSISAMGGTAPYKGTGDVILPTGVSKNYVVSDKNGCTAQQYVSMPDPPKIVATATINPPKCYGEMGSITISATGGTGALKGVGTFSVQAGKAYSFKVTDANGCSSNILTGIMPPEEILAVTITPLSSMCAGGSIELFVSATGGTPAYSGTGTVTVTLGSGNTYTYTVTDSGGCTASKSITVKVENPPAVPVLSIVAQPICFTPFGTIKVESPLGINYEYSIDGGTYTKSTIFGGLAPETTHTVKVKDITTGCENVSSAITIGAMPESLSAPALSVTQPGCFLPTGAIEVVDPASGTGFEYRFDAGVYSSTAILSNLAQGSTHSVTVRNITTGCFSSAATVVIGTIPANPAAPLLALTATPTCSNPDGNVSVLSPVNSGSKIYSYSIDGIKFQTSPVFADLTGTTTYTVVVRDDVSGCTSSSTAIYVPAVPPPPVISAIGVNPKCYGDTYTITISAPPVVSAGKTYSFDGTYTFYYDGGQFDNVKISGGIATITGTLTASKDFKNIHFTANGCTSTGTNTSISIVSPAAIDLRIVQVTEQAVKGTQQGAIDIDAKGGSGLLSYLWSNGATTQDLNPIKYGTYSVVVTDTKKCTAALTVKVPLNNPPVARPDVFTTNCSTVSGNLLDDNGSGKDYDPDPVEQADFISMNTALVVKPSHAANYTINADGSFVYTAEANFTGDDIFVYEIYDKLKQTATATVTIHIEADFDGDGIADLIDPDADGDGILNVDEALPGQDWKTADFDGDGHPNWLDIDSDNDGIVDNVEAQPTAGYIPPSGKDVNHNGIDDAYDPAMGGVKIIPVNTDANLYMPDNLPDFLDTDSDNDHVPDYIEGHDLNADGKVDEGHLITGKDSDSDGLDDAWDTIPNGCNNLNATGSNAYIQDFDGDGIRDWRDDNDDNDEYPTRLEDLNGDGDYSNDVTGHVGHPEYLWYGRDCSLFIPDAFSPNDDNVHDYFQIYCIEQYPNAKMYIFDQQGNKLFEKDHYGNVDYWGSHEQAWWDGTTTNRIAAVNGKKVVPGTYYYVLKLGNGETKKSFVFVSY
jgi:gliding motility-associated-like protein